MVRLAVTRDLDALTRAAYLGMRHYRRESLAHPDRPFLAEAAEDAAYELRGLLALRKLARDKPAPELFTAGVNPAFLMHMTVRELWAGYRFAVHMRNLSKRLPIKAERDQAVKPWTRVVDTYRVAAIHKQHTPEPLDDNSSSS